MTKTGNEPKTPGRKGRRTGREAAPTPLEDELQQTFHDIENEPVPAGLTRLAEKLDEAIEAVVRKKTN